MLFGNCKSKTNLQILIDDVSVERVNVITFLGVMIDHNICWKPHIKYIQSKISRSIAVLSKAKHFLNCAALHILYCIYITFMDIANAFTQTDFQESFAKVHRSCLYY